MPRQKSLRQLSTEAADTTAAPSLLTGLTRILFDPPEFAFWTDHIQSARGFVEPKLCQGTLERLKPFLTTLFDDLVCGEGLEDEALYRHLIKAESRLAQGLPKDEKSEGEVCAALITFAPLALCHLIFLSLLCQLSTIHDQKTHASWMAKLEKSIKAHLNFGTNGLLTAVAWRTAKLRFACKPTRPSNYGGATLTVQLTDTLIGRTIVDEACPAYPGRANPQLQRAVDRATLYEERLHHTALIFWENRILDILSPWEKGFTLNIPQAPDTMGALLDDALYAVMQDLSRMMMGMGPLR